MNGDELQSWRFLYTEVRARPVDDWQTRPRHRYAPAAVVATTKVVTAAAAYFDVAAMGMVVETVAAVVGGVQFVSQSEDRIVE